MGLKRCTLEESCSILRQSWVPRTLLADAAICNGLHIQKGEGTYFVIAGEISTLQRELQLGSNSLTFTTFFRY